MLDALLWVAFGCGVACLVGVLICMYLYSQALKCPTAHFVSGKGKDGGSSSRG